MSKKMVDFSKLSQQQQNKRIANFIKSEMMMEKNKRFQSNVIVKKSITSVTNSSQRPIIRIVPSYNKISIPKRNSVKTYILSSRSNVELESPPSTSNIQITDHTYLPKSEDIEMLDNYSDEFEAVTNEDSSCDVVNESMLMQDPKDIAAQREIETNVTTIPEHESKVHSEQCCCSCRETLELILKQQNEILKLFRKQNQMDFKLDLLPAMPFKDINDYLDFDESLTHENVKEQFIFKLNKLLVSTEQKSISNIMSSIMTNELCRMISWIGIKNTIAFGTTNMVGLIIDIVQEHHQIDMETIKSRIAEWLRRCGDRIGNEIRKQKKRAEQGYPV